MKTVSSGVMNTGDLSLLLAVARLVWFYESQHANLTSNTGGEAQFV